MALWRSRTSSALAKPAPITNARSRAPMGENRKSVSSRVGENDWASRQLMMCAASPPER